MPVPIVSASDARTALLDLVEGHPYRAVATGSFTPAGRQAASSWETARPLTEVVLATDLVGVSYREAHAASRRSALVGLLCWLAEDDPSLLSVEVSLSDDEIDRYLATDGMVRRTSHRSRVALRSALRSFQASFPDRFPRRPARPSGPDPVLEATEDWQFDAALAQCDGFRSALTRVHSRSFLLLARGAGLSGAELRYVTGSHVVTKPNAGLWVELRTPKAERDIPVLARFAAQLADLAVSRPDRCLISDVDAPCGSDATLQLSQMLNRNLARSGADFKVSAERLRKAWLAEHVAANVPLPTLLAAAGLRSLRAIETLVFEFGPPVSSNPAHVAYELGGVVLRRGDKR